jgi:hypothetical protein
MDPIKPKNLCLAPWTHTYLSPQTERRLCCASREPAQSFTQYIDTAQGSGSYTPVTLEQHWNSERMRAVRLKMLNNETIPECEVCNQQLLNTAVYRTYFDHLFGSKYNEVIESTDSTGATTMRPVSWDYRFSNLCNFKCRMCGDMLSSSWESEQQEHEMIDWGNAKNAWMQPRVKEQITQFQDSVVEQEFSDAVESHRVEEVYWVGGEPLMYEQHWRYMKRIIELGDGPHVYARYNTNLSRTRYQGIDLFTDILDHLRDYQICASLDGTGPIGEYIRTGLRYDQWLANFRQAVAHRRSSRQVRIDFTLTLPGLFEVEPIVQLAQEHNTEILAKLIFSFSPDIILSPLALPRQLLDPWLDELITNTTDALQDVLIQLKTRPTFAEQWPTSYQQGLQQGKARVLKLESIRTATTNMQQILAQRPQILEWWNAI